MWSRVDLEGLYMRARLFIVAILLLFVLGVWGYAKAEEPKPDVIITMLPVACTDSNEVMNKIVEGKTMVFQGVFDRTILYSLHVSEDGTFSLMMQKAGTPGGCLTGYGNEHNFINLVAPRVEQEAKQ